VLCGTFRDITEFRHNVIDVCLPLGRGNSTVNEGWELVNVAGEDHNFHIQTGNGKGDVDNDEKLPDFTNPDSLKDKSDGELFCLLKNGKGHMPLERIRISPNELWNLVNYVRSLAK
jgi:hypothetical protein